MTWGAIQTLDEALDRIESLTVSLEAANAEAKGLANDLAYMLDCYDEKWTPETDGARKRLAARDARVKP